MVLIRLQKVEFESVLQFFALASFVFDETWYVQGVKKLWPHVPYIQRQEYFISAIDLII